MIINSTLVFCLIPELQEAFKGNKIIQILQSSDRKELIFLTRSKEKETSLFFSTHAENYRIEICECILRLDENETKTRKSDYQKTNLFSYAVGGHISEISQVDFDRVIKISCLKKSQLGKSIEFDLIFELTGRNSNLILLRNDGLIIDCLRKVDFTQNRFRQILPGEKYVPPPSPKKENPFQIEKGKFLILLKDHDLLISEFLVSHFIGIDKLLAEKIIFEANLPISARTRDFNEENIEYLWKNFSQTFEDIYQHKLTFQIIINEKGKPQAISCVSLPFLKHEQKISCESLNSAIKKFFSQKLEEHQRKTELKRFSEVAHKAQARLESKKERIEEDLKQAEKFEEYKKFGDLLMMNKGLIKKGQASIKLVDIFQPEPSPTEISLNVKLSPMQNAQAYFKKYKKAKDALAVMKKRKAETEKEILQVEKILEKVDGATKELNLEQIEQELISLGILKDKKVFDRRKKSKSEFGSRGKEFSPRRFVTKDGGEILVGRNNKENDYLTFKIARPDDLWFHAQDVPGSHVVLRRKEKKKEPSHNDIKEAAQVAAYFSKARGATRVGVIYTWAKYVKKPKKGLVLKARPEGKPGLALVEKEKAIWVEPKLTDK
jgi:predicted ribosome quality control (RQC) complex YloA/Tae2 family protein